MKTPRVAIDHNLAEIVEYLPLPHIIWDLGQKQVLSQSEVEKINKDNNYASHLLTVLKRYNLDVYLAFCNSAEDAQSTVQYKYRWLIYDMRRALDSANYTWQWLDGENVINESCQHFTTEMACTLDGWKKKPVVATVEMWKPLKMLIINHAHDNKLIGVVNEVSNRSLEERDDIHSNPYQNRVKRQKISDFWFETLFVNMVDNVRIAVQRQGDGIVIDIRRCILRSDKCIPTKRGVQLPRRRFARLLWLQEQVADAMKDIREGKMVEKSLHVGGGLRLLMCSPFPTVHIQQYRRYYKTFKEKTGVILMYKQWLRLCHIAHTDAKLEKILPHLKYMTPCYTQDYHQWPRGAETCEECNFYTDAEEHRFSLPDANTSCVPQPPVAAKKLTKKKKPL